MTRGPVPQQEQKSSRPPRRMLRLVLSQTDKRRRNSHHGSRAKQLSLWAHRRTSEVTHLCHPLYIRATAASIIPTLRADMGHNDRFYTLSSFAPSSSSSPSCPCSSSYASAPPFSCSVRPSIHAKEARLIAAGISAKTSMVIHDICRRHEPSAPPSLYPHTPL